MSRLVDFTSKNLLGTLDGKCSHLIAELFTSALNLRGSLSLGGFDDAFGLDNSLGLGILNDRQSSLFAIGNDGGGTSTSSRLDGLALLVRKDQSLLALVRSSQAVSDLLLPLFNRVNQRWPDVLHGDPGTKQEHDHLNKQRGINVHY